MLRRLGCNLHINHKQRTACRPQLQNRCAMCEQLPSDTHPLGVSEQQFDRCSTVLSIVVCPLLFRVLLKPCGLQKPATSSAIQSACQPTSRREPAPNPQKPAGPQDAHQNQSGQGPRVDQTTENWHPEPGRTCGGVYPWVPHHSRRSRSHRSQTSSNRRHRNPHRRTQPHSRRRRNRRRFRHVHKFLIRCVSNTQGAGQLAKPKKQRSKRPGRIHNKNTSNPSGPHSRLN